MDKKAKLRSRAKAMEVHYKTYWKGNCYYCGDLSSTIDHVPALTIAYSLGADELDKRRIKMLKVSSCLECNALLSDRPLMTLKDRAKFIYSTLQNRYKKYINSPYWDDEELAELGPNLLSKVVITHTVHDWIERRLQFMEDVFYDEI